MQTWTREEQKAHREELCVALESGRYSQAQHCLHDDRGFCCLGVAEDIRGSERWTRRGNFFGIGDGDSFETTYLTLGTRDYYGFQTCTGGYTPSDEFCTSLAERNDNYASFSEIASIIRSEPDGLIATD